MKYIFFILSIMLGACSSEQDNYSEKNGYVKVSDFKIKELGPLNANEWKCYDLQYDRICCPINWKASEQRNSLISAPLSDTDLNTFFIVLRHDEEAEELTISKYLNVVYDTMQTDTIEKLLDYNCKKLIFDNASKEIFYIEFLVEKNNSKYVALCMYVSQNGLLYDITLKVPQSKRDEYYDTFETVLYNYKANGKELFSKKEKLIAFKYVDLDTLKS